MEDQDNSSERSPRIDVRLEGVLTMSDGVETPVIVTDVSVDGFRLESQDELLPDEMIRLQVGKGPSQNAQIKWVIGNEAGGVFLD